MITKFAAATGAVLGAMMLVASAEAAVIHSDAFGPGGPGRATDTSFSVNFNSTSAGASGFSFDLLGYLSLDGQNFYEDQFTLSLNGVDIFKAAFDLGGGGLNVVYLNTPGLVNGPVSSVFFAGGNVTISGIINLVAGLNTLDFSYDSLPDPGHAGFQGIGDESWGVETVDVANVSAVPVPAALPLLATAMLGLGFLARSRRQA